MIDLFLLCVDRDGVPGRRQALDAIENRAHGELLGRRALLAENAWQEIEVWVLAGHDLPREWKWEDVRSEPDPKEAYFTPFADRRGLAQAPHEGRKLLAEEAAGRYDRIRALCPEDVQALEARVQAFLT